MPYQWVIPTQPEDPPEGVQPPLQYGAADRVALCEFVCDGCGNDICWDRWHCTTCQDYDLCHACKASKNHAHYMWFMGHVTEIKDLAKAADDAEARQSRQGGATRKRRRLAVSDDIDMSSDPPSPISDLPETPQQQPSPTPAGADAYPMASRPSVDADHSLDMTPDEVNGGAPVVEGNGRNTCDARPASFFSPGGSYGDSQSGVGPHSLQSCADAENLPASDTLQWLIQRAAFKRSVLTLAAEPTQEREVLVSKVPSRKAASGSPPDLESVRLQISGKAQVALSSGGMDYSLVSVAWWGPVASLHAAPLHDPLVLAMTTESHAAIDLASAEGVGALQACQTVHLLELGAPAPVRRMRGRVMCPTFEGKRGSVKGISWLNPQGHFKMDPKRVGALAMLLDTDEQSASTAVTFTAIMPSSFILMERNTTTAIDVACTGSSVRGKYTSCAWLPGGSTLCLALSGVRDGGREVRIVQVSRKDLTEGTATSFSRRPELAATHVLGFQQATIPLVMTVEHTRPSRMSLWCLREGALKKLACPNTVEVTAATWDSTSVPVCGTSAGEVVLQTEDGPVCIGHSAVSQLVAPCPVASITVAEGHVFWSAGGLVHSAPLPRTAAQCDTCRAVPPLPSPLCGALCSCAGGVPSAGGAGQASVVSTPLWMTAHSTGGGGGVSHLPDVSLEGAVPECLQSQTEPPDVCNRCFLPSSMPFCAESGIPHGPNPQGYTTKGLSEAVRGSLEEIISADGADPASPPKRSGRGPLFNGLARVRGIEEEIAEKPASEQVRTLLASSGGVVAACRAGSGMVVVMKRRLGAGQEQDKGGAPQE